MSDRQALDQQVLTGEYISADVLQAALDSDSPPQGDLRVHYAERLLERALDSREPELMERVADLMDAELSLDQALTARLNERLEEQPDAVYAFVRGHLTETLDKKWLRRLKLAALFSLRVAINDADAETIVKWLTLIAREPATYDLIDVLHYGILAAQERAHRDPELARQLVLLAARRDTNSLNILLDDPALMVALPNNVGKVLRDLEGDPLMLLQNRGAEIFLVGMARAARARSGTMFTPAVVTKLWEYLIDSQPIPTLPTQYQPTTVIQELAAQGTAFLRADTLETLLTLMLSGRRDDLVLKLFDGQEAARNLLPLLVPAMERSQRTINEAIDLIGRLVSEGCITPTQAADLIVNMLNGMEWGKDSLPLMQQLARLFQQHPTIKVQTEVLHKVLTQAGELKDEFIARQTVKRLVGALEKTDDEDELVTSLKKIASASAWSEAVRGFITQWWRTFARGQSLNRLGKLEKLFEGRRTLEAERDITQTLISLRKMLGGRSLQAFAGDIKAAYSILESLSEAFDPDAKHTANFDPAIVREELDARDDQISPEERQVLANNLKELARLIAEMGDARTKSSLMRREDDLDRDLMAGDQTPHSAVDTMKWLSGYWGETRDEDEGQNPA